MSRRGDDEGFHPHPGDPWHPGWTSDDDKPPAEAPASEAPAEGESAVEALVEEVLVEEVPAEPTVPAEAAKKEKRRGRKGRRGRQPEPEASQPEPEVSQPEAEVDWYAGVEPPPEPEPEEPESWAPGGVAAGWWEEEPEAAAEEERLPAGEHAPPPWEALPVVEEEGEAPPGPPPGAGPTVPALAAESPALPKALEALPEEEVPPRPVGESHPPVEPAEPALPAAEEEAAVSTEEAGAPSPEPPPPMPAPGTAAPPSGAPPATAEEEAARAVEHLMGLFPPAQTVPEAVEAAGPSWPPPAPEPAPSAAEEAEERSSPAAAEPEEEVQADEWLAFVDGSTPPGPPSIPASAAAVTAPAPASSETEEEEAAPGPEAPLKARRHLFGRRGRGTVPEEPSLEAVEGETGGAGAAAAEAELPAAAAAGAVEPEHRPPPWAPPDIGLPATAGAAAPAGTPGPLPAGVEDAAWVPVPPAGPPPIAPPEVTVRPAAEPVPAPPAEPPRPLHLWEPPEELPSDGEEEEGVEEWVGDPGALPASWFAEIDEDQVAVPPAGLPEEEAPEEEAAWETWPLPPTAPGPAYPEEATGRAAPEPEPLAGEEELEAAGWEEFPEPGRPVPRVESAPAAPPEEAAWGFPQGGEQEGDEGEEPWPAEGEEAWAQEGWEQPVPAASAGEPTEEIPAPEVYDFEGRRQGPISEEVVAGAVTMEHRGLAKEIAAADTAETELQALSAPMAGLDSGVVGFEDVVHLGGDEEFVAPRRSDMGLRVATGMLLAALLLGAMWVGGEFLAGFIGLLVIIGLGEFYGTLRRHGYQPLALFGFLGGVGILVGTWFYGLVAIPVAVVATTVLTFFYYAFAPRRRDALTNGGLTVLGLLWVTGTAAFAYPIAAADHFQVLVLAIVAAVVATDIGALAAGRAWGSRPLAPVLSPHKTVEGLAGGVVLGIAVAVAAGRFLRPLDVRSGAALGLIVALMAPLGDLAESMLKRSLGVKDMGATLPGHGGILDRIDAFLFVLPAAWVLYETLGLLH